MTGPDGGQSHNKAHSQGSGTVYQAGQIHGDAHMGDTRTTTISLPAFGVVIGVVLTLVVGFGVWKLVAADGQASGTSATQTKTPPDGLRTKEVHLTRDTGVDVDGNDIAASPADGAIGDVDLHLGQFNLLQANGGGFWRDAGPEQQAQQRCTKAIAGGKHTDEKVLPAASGDQYCFATSDRQVGWLRVKNGNLASTGSDASIVLAVRVWPRP